MRLRLIQKETQHYPDPSIVGYLFRKRGAQFDSQEARHIACYVDEKDLLPLLGRARDTLSDFSDLIRELCAARMAIPSHELEVIPLNETARITA